MGCPLELLPAYAKNAIESCRRWARQIPSLGGAGPPPRAYLYEASAHSGAAIDGPFTSSSPLRSSRPLTDPPADSTLIGRF
jgi:hypothetical protein